MTAGAERMESIRTAGLQDRLTGTLIGIARAVAGNEHLISDSTDKIVREGLRAALTNFDDESLAALIRRAGEEKIRLIPHCYECASPCGKNNDYDMQRLWTAGEDIRSRKLLLLYGIQGMAVHICRAAALGYVDHEVNRFFYRALFAIGEEGFGVQELLPLMTETGTVAWKCMTLLGAARIERCPAAENEKKAMETEEK